MHHECLHDAHGFAIASDLPLPEFPILREFREPCITISQSEELPLPDYPGERYWVNAQGFYIGWNEVGTFHVTPKGHINYRRDPRSSDELIRVPLLGSILGVALYYRGVLVLHGNTMSVNGNGIILVGAKGQGKSTLSAALVAHGHLVHAEDAASVQILPGPVVRALCGTRQLRLWNDSIEHAFRGSAPVSRQIHELSEKRVVPLVEQAETRGPLSLKCVYVLENADEIVFQPLGASEAWQLILVHSLVARFGTDLLTGESAARHFASCAALAKSVRCVRLRRPRDFSRLGSVVSQIEQDLLHV